MRKVDEKTIKSYGITGAVLMERAGLAVVSRIGRMLNGRKALIMAGPGNNGGDGIMIARELTNMGYRATVLIAGKKEKLSQDCKAQYEIAREFKVPMRFTSSPGSADLHGAFVVDALFGTGLKKEIRGPLADTIKSINASGCPVVAVDIPSGISADTGQVLGTAIRADFTVTFGALKRGHLLYPGAEHSGEVSVHDIGFPRSLIDSITCDVLDHEGMSRLMPSRGPASHKGTHGHLLVVAGSRGKTGAAFMASEAALRTGAGLVTLATPEPLADIYQSRVTEAMVLPLPSTPDAALSHEAMEGILEFASNNASAMVIGPGLGRDEETTKLVKGLIQESPVPMVIDADALFALGNRSVSMLGKSRHPAILTPHPGEFARLSGMSVDDIQADRPAAAITLARKSRTCVVLKGAPTVIAGPGGELFINSTGGPALAKAGTGDVLAGMLGALTAMGLSPLGASALGTYLHGLAGDMAARQMGDHSTVASDVIGLIHAAIDHITGGGDDLP